MSTETNSAKNFCAAFGELALLWINTYVLSCLLLGGIRINEQIFLWFMHGKLFGVICFMIFLVTPPQLDLPILGQKQQNFQLNVNFGAVVGYFSKMFARLWIPWLLFYTEQLKYFRFSKKKRPCHFY